VRRAADVARMRVAALLGPGALLALCSACTATAPAAGGSSAPQVRSTVLGSGAGVQACRNGAAHTFGQQDFIVFCVEFGWPSSERGGSHAIEWRWYQDRRLVSKLQKQVTFASNPYTLWTRRAAATLGSGHFRVEALVDGALASSASFDIAAQ
jgi:hypothetical protein